jgi:uracil phosphoribosyltransferase
MVQQMLASGITAQLAIEVLVDEGVKPEDITVLNLIVTPQVGRV